MIKISGINASFLLILNFHDLIKLYRDEILLLFIYCKYNTCVFFQIYIYIYTHIDRFGMNERAFVISTYELHVNSVNPCECALYKVADTHHESVNSKLQKHEVFTSLQDCTRMHKRTIHWVTFVNEETSMNDSPLSFVIVPCAEFCDSAYYVFAYCQNLRLEAKS